MSWREPIPSEVEPDPLAQLMEEVKHKRTWNDVWQRYVEERIERGEEIDDEGAHDFNLNKTMEMK